MNHKKGNKKLNKPTDQRLALLKNLSYSLISNSELKTTSLRAKQTKKMIEKLITLAKQDTLHSKRQILKVINNKVFLSRIMQYAKENTSSNGGYVKIIKSGLRKGDSAELSTLKLI